MQLKHLDVELTERCNNNCIHCYINLPRDDPAEKNELTADQIKKVLSEAASLGCMSLTYTGGEPLLRADFKELYVYARKLGMFVAIRTNATLIDARLAETLSRIPPMAPVWITAYGMSKKTYEAVTRVPGSFEAFKNGIELLKANNVPYKLSSTIFRSNLKELDQLESFIVDLSCGNELPSYSLCLDLRGRRENDKNAVLKRLRLPPENVLSILKRRGNYREGMIAFCKQFSRISGDTLLSCNAGRESCSLDAYGHLQPCLQLRHPDVTYDIKNGSIRDAMTRFFPMVRKLKAKSPDYLSRCADCFLKGLCDNCPAKSWMEHGTLDTPVDYLCEVTHLQARYLGLINEGEKAWEIEDWRERINSIN